MTRTWSSNYLLVSRQLVVVIDIYRPKKKRSGVLSSARRRRFVGIEYILYTYNDYTMWSIFYKVITRSYNGHSFRAFLGSFIGRHVRLYVYAYIVYTQRTCVFAASKNLHIYMWGLLINLCRGVMTSLISS